MGRKSRDKKQKKEIGTEMNTLGQIFGSSKIMQSSLKSISKQENTQCKVYDREVNELKKLLADVATGIWRIKNKLSAVDIEAFSDDVKKACRHLESTWDALSSAKVEVRDYTKEKYVTGMALNVIAFQPSSSVKTEIITETIKPSIFYKGKLIQMGDVIVETPENTVGKS